MQNELSSDPLSLAARLDAAPALSAQHAKQSALDVRITPSGYRVYTKLMPAPLSILRTDRGLDDKQPVSLVYVSILG